MREIVKINELLHVAGGDSEATRLEDQNSYGQNYSDACGGSFSDTSSFDAFGTTVNVCGSVADGLATAGTNCLSGASMASLGNNIAISSVGSLLSSAGAAVLGCTIGVGRGLLRQMEP